MDQVEVQNKGLDALKMLNNAVTTSRLYPSEAPQVANAIDRGFAGLRNFLESYTNLEFSIVNNEPQLCGEKLSPEVLASFPNLVIYRQLSLLEVNCLILNENVDRFAFGQLLTVLTASAEKIKKLGGGLQYITSLGLVGFFSVSSEDESGPNSAGSSGEDKIKKSVKVRPELVACLLGKDDRPLIVEELHSKMVFPDQCVMIMAAGIGKILQGIQKKKRILATPLFPELLKNGDSLINEEHKAEVTMKLAEFLAASLKETALCVLMSQEFSDSFADNFYESLIGSLPAEKLGAVIVVFREQIARYNKEGGDTKQVEFFGRVMNRLISSEKGKQYLSTEKARSLIRGGEKERTKKRLEAGISGLLAGRMEVLENEELLHHLPGTVRQLLRGENRDYVPKLITYIRLHLNKVEGEQRAKVIESLVAIAERLLEDEEYELLNLIVELLIAETRRSNISEKVFERKISLLQAVMQNNWRLKEYEKGDRILNLFYQMRSKRIDRPESLRTIVARIQDSNINRSSLPRLLTECLADPENDTLRYRMVLQGPVAIRFMVETLINAEESDERLKLIDVLTSVGTFTPGVVKERLQGHMPWFGKRNLLKLLGETGAEEDAEIAIPYLHHSDFRVQREAFLCIYRIGGRKRKTIFLSVLDESPVPIQIQIVEAFAGFCDREIALKLGEILSDSTGDTGSNREKMVLATIKTLERCPCDESIQAIEAFLAGRKLKANRDISDPIWAAAEKAGVYLENEMREARKRHVQASQLRKNALITAAGVKRAIAGHRNITGLPQEQLIRSLLAKDDKDGAVKELLSLIEKTAKSRNIPQAEQLREWLVEIDGTDLGMGLRAIEIIEKEKSVGVMRDHLDVWDALYDYLTTEEFGELTEGLIKESYQPGELIVSQGALQRALFFINSGKVKLYFSEKAGEVLINTMGPGEIFGTDVFFNASIWTMSIGAVEAASISVLRFDRLHQWKENFPALEAKLKAFCDQFDDSEKIMKDFAKDRRRFTRFKLSGEVKTILLDSRKRRIGYVVETELMDISRGGLSYKVVLDNVDNVKHLLGHRVQVDMCTGGSPDDIIEKEGDIIALKNSPGGETYSVHVKFSEQLETPLMDKIVRWYQPAS